MFVPFPTKFSLFRNFISLGSRNIYVFSKTIQKNLNAHLEKFGELGLKQLGFNSAFKRLMYKLAVFGISKLR